MNSFNRPSTTITPAVSDPIIRPAQPGDLAAVVDIYNQSIPSRLSTAEPLPFTPEQKRAWFDNHDQARRPLDVLDDQGQVIGWVELKDHYGRAAYAATAEIGLYLAQDRLGMGHGKRLLDHMIARCPMLGVTTLLAICLAPNKASLALFNRAGFRQWGYYPGVINLDGQLIDTVHLGLGRRLINAVGRDGDDFSR